jgi:hypothetical protein
MRWLGLWFCVVCVVSSANTPLLAQSGLGKSQQKAHDRLISKIDDANAQVDGLFAELAALKEQSAQDPENLKRALASVSSLEQLFDVARKYPLWRMGNNDLYYAFQTKFHTLNRESVSNLKPDSAEHRQALKQSEARYNQLLSDANAATREYFNRAESILAKMRIHQDYSGKLIDLGNERMKADEDAQAQATQRDLVKEVKALREEVRGAGQRVADEVRDAEWRLRNW